MCLFLFFPHLLQHNPPIFRQLGKFLRKIIPIKSFHSVMLSSIKVGSALHTIHNLLLTDETI